MQVCFRRMIFLSLIPTAEQLLTLGYCGQLKFAQPLFLICNPGSQDVDEVISEPLNAGWLESFWFELNLAAELVCAPRKRQRHVLSRLRQHAVQIRQH